MEQEPIRVKPPCAREDALEVLRRLREAGHVAYFAGGCVRDLLMQLEPKDYDIATDAPPKRVRQLFRSTQAVGALFGVILVRQGSSVVEVATFRSEGPYLDGRRPEKVSFTTAEQDAQRRDFTINGIFYDPLDDRFIDHVGGRDDLAARRLRAIGIADERFAEDHLRLLRAVRFAARFGLEIEPATAAAMERHAPSLKRISPERIADELRLTLTAPTRALAWPMLWRFGLNDVIYRFLTPRPTGAFLPERSIFLSLAPGRPIGFGLALAAGALCWQWQGLTEPGELRALFGRASVKHMGRAMRQALKISNEELDEMQGTLEGLEPLLADVPPTVAAKKRFLARPTSEGSRALMEALAEVGMFEQRVDALRGELAELASGEYAPTPLVNGDELVAAGFTPGPAFKRVLDAVYDAQLEGRVSTKEEALGMARSMLAS